LLEEEDCRLQFGGSDQWGNIANGCDFIRKKTGSEAFGITMPLLLTKSGQKFGKSEGNALFLNPQRTPPSALHQYLFNTADD
jgi:tyrosyl-tRNA synthetase